MELIYGASLFDFFFFPITLLVLVTNQLLCRYKAGASLFDFVSYELWILM